jgi:predicted DNA-binding transcriptional regulator AlpA
MRQNSTTKLRPQTARLTCRLLAPLLDSGLVSSDEYAIIKRNLDALAKTGELAPAIPQKLITPQEAAELLSISYSNFRAMEKAGKFPFKRRCIGGKTVRYLNTEILDYMLVGSIGEGENDDEET